ncbi:hypothetical protein Tco_1518735, partial [Tanacetum coccineum]
LIHDADMLDLPNWQYIRGPGSVVSHNPLSLWKASFVW